MNIGGLSGDSPNLREVVANPAISAPRQTQESPKSEVGAPRSELLATQLEDASRNLSALFSKGQSGLTDLSKLLENSRIASDQNWLERIRELQEGKGTQIKVPPPPPPEVQQNPAEDGGPAWTEVRNPDGSSYRYRDVAEPDDGKGMWREVERDGQRYKMRTYEENGESWAETIAGGNRWRYRNGGAPGLQAESRAQGSQTLTIQGDQGPVQITIHGRIEPHQLAILTQALSELPPPVVRLARTIYINERLGEVLQPDGSNPVMVAGFADAEHVMLDRTQLNSLGSCKFVLYHELGHVADFSANPPHSSRPPWGQPPSVSPYGATNAWEDYAEVHRDVLERWSWFESYDAGAWGREVAWEKKHEIFVGYGGRAPSRDEIREAAQNQPPFPPFQDIMKLPGKLQWPGSG